MDKFVLYKFEQKFLNGYYSELEEIVPLLHKQAKLISTLSDKESVAYTENLLIYTINQHTYHFFVLSTYFGRSVMSDNSREGYLGYGSFTELEKKGWTIFDKSVHPSSYVERDFEKIYMSYLEHHFFNVFPRDMLIYNDFANNYYQESITAYLSDKYYLCVCGLFPVIEYLHRKLAKFDGKKIYMVKDNLKKTEKNIEEIQKNLSGNFKYYSTIMSSVNNLIKNSILSKSVEKDPEPLFINRNRVSHGIFTREISKKDCLQLFSVINCQKRLLDIMLSDIEMRRLSNKIDDLKAELARKREEK